MTPDVFTPPSLFERFNARRLDPDEVARFFVPPDHFWRLTDLNHTLLVGPRGSGKTTLLKMLTPQAIQSWRHDRAPEARARALFAGVFVPSDVVWRNQAETLLSDYEERQRELILRALFSWHVLRCTIGAVRSRRRERDIPTGDTHRPLLLSRADEHEVVSEIASALELKISLPTLRGLENALRSQTMGVDAFISRESTRTPEGRHERLAEYSPLHQSLLSSLSLIIELLAPFEKDQLPRWAFLFDELELTPSSIQQQLFTWMRSVDERIIFKLSISPYAGELALATATATGPTAGHDFNSILLTYPSKERGYGFCNALFSGILSEEELPPWLAHEVFGFSAFDSSADAGTSRARSDVSEETQKRFVALSEKDPTFESYLELHSIDPHNIRKMSEPERAALIRKLASILAVREYYYTEERVTKRGRPSGRSRKGAEIYSGATALFSMVEGNPRLFIGIIGDLVQKYRAQLRELPPSAGGRPRRSDRPLIPRQVQGRAVLEASERFRALLQTIPVPEQVGSDLAVADVLDGVGRYIHEHVVAGAFNPDPPGTFFFDAAAVDLEGSLAAALNVGAIVLIPKRGQGGVLTALTGQRFRLSYLLAPEYKIPLILLRALNLSTMIFPPRDPLPGSEGRSEDKTETNILPLFPVERAV